MADTLWNKGTKAADVVEEFTIGNDRTLDLALAEYDIRGSQAHIRMLESIGLLTAEEHMLLSDALNEISNDIQDGKFSLEDDVEDIHSQIELILTRKLGDIGKKIHSGRSRNDQVLVDIKLFLRDELLKIRNEATELFEILQNLSETNKDILFPGYTHGQVAMPSSFGLWFGAYAEAIADDMFMMRGAYHLVNQNPLGSAAGYGNSFPLDRELTTDLLGFEDMDYNSIAAQLSRGKTEKATAAAIGCLALTLNRFASDCCLYMSTNFQFISFPDELTTGSSIMPHKKNPDVWEIIRGNCNRIMAAENEISMLCSNMPHGYHRDFQLLKDILFPALILMHKCIRMTSFMLKEIRINEHIIEAKDYQSANGALPPYDLMFTVEEVNRRVINGMPFRDAYKSVGIEVKEGKFKTDRKVHHTHAGSIGNLCNDKIAEKMKRATDFC